MTIHKTAAVEAAAKKRLRAKTVRRSIVPKVGGSTTTNIIEATTPPKPKKRGCRCGK